MKLLLCNFEHQVVTNTWTVSQEILLLGNYVAATKFPRKYGHSILTKQLYFLGNFVAPRKIVAWSDLEERH